MNAPRSLVGIVALLGLLALSGCVSVTRYDDDDGYYRCHGGRCYYNYD
jgi:hypothetical protein